MPSGVSRTGGGGGGGGEGPQRGAPAATHHYGDTAPLGARGLGGIDAEGSLSLAAHRLHTARDKRVGEAGRARADNTGGVIGRSGGEKC